MKKGYLGISDREQENKERNTNVDHSQENDDSSLEGGLKKIKLTKSAANPKSSGSSINKPKYPTIETMVMEAILALNDSKGSSAHAIHKYIKSKWPVDNEKRRAFYVRKTLKACTVIGDLEQVRLFKVSANWKMKEKDKKTTGRKADKKLVKNKEAEEKKNSQEEKPKKEKTKKTSEKKPLKDKKADSIKPKSRPKSKVAAKEIGQADEEVTTKKSSEKKLLCKKAKIRKSIGTLIPEVAKPVIKSVKKIVAGVKNNKSTKKALSESSDKGNEQLGLEPKAADARKKKASGKVRGKIAKPNKQMFVIKCFW